MTILPTETALAILASHGADPARWPAESRDSLLALAGTDAAVAAALAEAKALDCALADWLAGPVPPLAVNIGAIVAQPQGRPQPAAARWRPALLAASLALVVAAAGWFGVKDSLGGNATTVVASTSPPLAGVELAEADAAFAYVFTPTAAEEELI